MADITDIERLNYYEGEYLGAADFEAEQEYHRDMRRRHNVGHHTWGIVTGLDVAQFLNGGPNNEVDVYIQPGLAVDGFGREIVLLSPFQLTFDMFADFAQKRNLSIWIAYSQQMIQPSPDACATAGQTNAYSRVQESYQIVIAPNPPTSDPVIVGGNPVQPISATGWTQPANTPPLPVNEGDVVIPPDDSVPFQALPDDNTTANWLVQLGQVTWDGVNNRFVQISNANTGRQYVGSVAQSIYAPAGVLTIQDRSTPSPLPAGATGVAAEVQGTLTVDLQLTAESDVWIDSPGILYFKDTGGVDGDTPLWIQRIDGAASGADLHIHIGDGKQPQHLTVGFGTSTGSSDTTAFSVGSDGNVDIPDGSLSFGTQLAQILNLWGTSYGIGVQTATLYFRSGSDFAWYVGGTYAKGQDDPGGGTLSMKLDSGGDLYVNGALAIDQAGLNNASINPGLTFGISSGEGIASKRTAGGNQYGLDFYTDFAPRVSITNSGNVGIGTSAPDAALNLAGGMWDVTNTEGDLKIGNDTYRLKMGVALGGAGAGDARIRAVGGTSRLMLGSGSNDVLTIVGTNVGINTISPGFALDVAGGLNVSGGITASGGMTLSGGLSVSGGVSLSGGLSGSGGANLSGGMSLSGDLNVSGNINATGSKAGYVVERFVSHAKKPFERGDVVVLHSKPKSYFFGVDNRIPLIEVTLATKSQDTRVCGIVDEPSLDASKAVGVDLSAAGEGNIGTMVTLGAYAHCKVDADISPIEAGDLLGTSPTRGHAQKLDPAEAPAGAVIGKALASLDKGQGIIPILVLHQ